MQPFSRILFHPRGTITAGDCDGLWANKSELEDCFIVTFGGANEVLSSSDHPLLMLTFELMLTDPALFRVGLDFDVCFMLPTVHELDVITGLVSLPSITRSSELFPIAFS